MQLRVFRSGWGLLRPGHGAAALRSVLPGLTDVGYAGLVYPTFLVPGEERQGWFDALAAHRMGLVDLVYTLGDDWAEHLASFRSQLEALATGPQRPRTRWQTCQDV